MGMLLRRHRKNLQKESSDLEKPTTDSTVTEIKDYLTSQGIVFDAKLTKDKLLELVV